MSSWLFYRILEKYHIGYLLAGDDLRVESASSGVAPWTGKDNLDGRLLTDVFPELVGVENILAELVRGMRDEYIIPRIQRISANGTVCYFDLCVGALPAPSRGFLVLLIDTTDAALQAQTLQTQRNELRLVALDLYKANQQIGYLLKRFVPEQVAEKLIRSRRLPVPGLERQVEATIFVADMRNYSEMAEYLPPRKVLDLLNGHLNLVGEAISMYGGRVIQIAGDMLLAAFNVLDVQPDHAGRAARAALTALEGLHALTNQEGVGSTSPVNFGIGLHTGPVITGYLGAGDQYEYAVTGEATNVAFWLCSHANPGQILITHATLEQLGGMEEVETLGKVEFKHHHSVEVYELKGMNEG